MISLETKENSKSEGIKLTVYGLVSRRTKTERERDRESYAEIKDSEAEIDEPNQTLANNNVIYLFNFWDSVYILV